MTDTDDDKVFKELTDAAMATEAMDLLDKQLTRCKTWVMERLENGESATLADLMRQVITEPNKRRHVLIAYSAALWKLMGEPDADRG